MKHMEKTFREKVDKPQIVRHFCHFNTITHTSQDSSHKYVTQPLNTGFLKWFQFKAQHPLCKHRHCNDVQLQHYKPIASWLVPRANHKEMSPHVPSVVLWTWPPPRFSRQYEETCWKVEPLCCRAMELQQPENLAGLLGSQPHSMLRMITFF